MAKAFYTDFTQSNLSRAKWVDGTVFPAKCRGLKNIPLVITEEVLIKMQIEYNKNINNRR